jgi:hypothetical protein
VREIPILERVGAFYRQPTGSGSERRIFSLLVLGCGVMLLVAFFVPYFHAPIGGDYFILWLAGFTGLLGAVAVLRKERGVIGAAAATVAVLAIASVALLFCFAVTVSWLLSVLMPD